MKNQNLLSQTIKFVLLGGASALIAMPAFAQDESDTDEDTLAPVEVTGSRIRRAAGETALPVLSIGREEIARLGLPVLADVLRELSVNGPSLSLNTNNGNTSGNSGVNLRNCASNRTLVLVNGRRWVSSNGLAGSVDLGSIPLAAVDRIEVLKDGASALYGTDAICGVINVLTRTSFDGAQFEGYYGEFDDGDGERESVSMTMGGSTERFSGSLNVSYLKQNAVFAGDREISRVPLFGFPSNTSAPGRASGVGPFGGFNVPGLGQTTLRPGAQGCLPNQVCAPARTADFKPFDFVTDGYNFAPDNYLSQPQVVRSVFGQASYSLSDRIRAKTEIFYTNRNGDAQLAAQPLAPLTISAQNIYNPFAANIVGGSYRPINFPRRFGQDQDTWRFVGGLEGDFDFSDRTLYWDAGYNFSENRQVQLKEGFYFTTRINSALGPSFINSQGVAACGTPTAVIAGCVPLNVFGGPSGLTRPMFDYITVSPRNLQESTQESITANISGDVFELPGGPLAFAFGLERRKESGLDNPDPLTNAGLVLGDNPQTPTSGKFSVDEAYLELRVPVLSDVAFAKTLEVSLASRFSDYSSFGSTTNSKASLRWQVVDDILVRGSWGEGFRAPSVNELFQGNATGRPGFQDPCSATNPLFISSAQTRAQCLASGAPVGFVSQLSQTFLTTGGNVGLQPETSTSKTLGVVYSPQWLAGLDMYVDWYNIEINDAIGGRGTNDILNGCFSEINPLRCALITRDTTGAVNGNRGEISNIDSRNQNFRGGLETEGFDFGGGYRYDMNDWGLLQLRLDNTYVSYFGDVDKPDRGDVNSDGDISSGNVVGQLPGGSSGGAPRHRLRSNLSTTWVYGDFSLSTTLEYRSKINESCNNVNNTALALGRINPSFNALRDLCTEPGRIIDSFVFTPGTQTVVTRVTPSPRNKLGGVTYTTLQGAWQAPWDGNVSLGIRNLFDKEPPFSSDAFANSYDAQYQIPGRFFYMSYTQKF